MSAQGRVIVALAPFAVVGYVGIGFALARWELATTGLDMDRGFRALSLFWPLLFPVWCVALFRSARYAAATKAFK